MKNGIYYYGMHNDGTLYRMKDGEAEFFHAVWQPSAFTVAQLKQNNVLTGMTKQDAMEQFPEAF